jgi:hypothetical protein
MGGGGCKAGLLMRAPPPAPGCSNDSLGKTIASTKEDGEVVKAHKEVTETGMTVFSFDEPAGEDEEGR